MVAKVLPGIGKGVDEEMKTKHHKKGNAEKLGAHHSAAFRKKKLANPVDPS